MNLRNRPDFTAAGGLKRNQQIKRRTLCEQSQKDGLIHKAMGGDRYSLCWASRLQCLSLKTQISANHRFFFIQKDGWNDAPGMMWQKRRGFWGYCGINYKLLVVYREMKPRWLNFLMLLYGEDQANNTKLILIQFPKHHLNPLLVGSGSMLLLKWFCHLKIR